MEQKSLRNAVGRSVYMRYSHRITSSTPAL